MKFECNTEKIKAAITLTARFTPKNPNLPILKTILITAHEGEVILRSTNLECGVEIRVPAKVDVGGVAAVPGDILAGFMGNIAVEKSITFTLDSGVLRVQSQRARAAIKTLPHDDFPTLPTVSAEQSFSMRGGELSKLIRAVGFCASVSGIKPELQSVLLYGEAGKVFAVATDSFRLAEKTIAAKKVHGFPNIIIPIRNAAELARLLDGVSEDIDVYYNGNQLSTRFGSVYYTTRLIDGSFPNYRAIIPKENSTEAVVLKEDLSSAFKLISIFADKFAQVIVGVEPKEKTVTLSARNADVGENTVTLKAAADGSKIEMSFNGRYLADGLQSIQGESVRFAWSGQGKPLSMGSSGDTSFLYIVMPMNR